jgi:hypothetical protein
MKPSRLEQMVAHALDSYDSTALSPEGAVKLLAAAEAGVWEEVSTEVDEIIRQGPLGTDWALLSRWCRISAHATRAQEG